MLWRARRTLPTDAGMKKDIAAVKNMTRVFMNGTDISDAIAKNFVTAFRAATKIEIDGLLAEALQHEPKAYRLNEVSNCQTGVKKDSENAQEQKDNTGKSGSALPGVGFA